MSVPEDPDKSPGDRPGSPTQTLGLAPPADAAPTPDAAEAPTPAAIFVEPVPSVRFCGTCGAPWQPEWSECAPCAAAAGRGLAAGTSPALGEAADDKPRLRTAILLYFALLAVSASALVAQLAGADELRVDFVSGAGMTAVVLAWCLFGARPALATLFRPASPKWFALGAGAALATFGLAVVVIGTVVRVFGLEAIDYVTPFTDAGHGLWVVVLMICVQPAVVEELAFRGVVLGALRPTLTTTEAVFVSAGMFMILHLTPAAFPHTFALGLIAGFMRVRTGSLLPCVLMHFVHNLLCVVMEYRHGG